MNCDKQYLDYLYEKRYYAAAQYSNKVIKEDFPDDGYSVKVHNEEVRQLKIMVDTLDECIFNFIELIRRKPF